MLLRPTPGRSLPHGIFGPPKSDAGRRVVAIPEVITADLASHIVTYAAPGDDGLVFTSPQGSPLRLSNFCRRVWRPALRAAGLPVIHFHDLRHTGNQLAADAGANLRELMDRMGHSTTRAAMAYLHGSGERQQAGGGCAQAAESGPIGHATGTAAGESIVSVNGLPGHVLADLLFWSSAPGRIRTRDPLLRRYRWRVARRRLASLYGPSGSSYCGWLSEDVARHRSPLAHLLAHQNLVVFANVRIEENNVEHQVLRRFRPLSSHPAHDTVSSTALASGRT